MTHITTKYVFCALHGLNIKLPGHTKNRQLLNVAVHITTKWCDINLKMELAVNSLPTSIDHFESVATVAVHVTIAEWCATTAEQKRDLVRCFRPKTQKVPEHIGILSQQHATAVSIGTNF